MPITVGETSVGQSQEAGPACQCPPFLWPGGDRGGRGLVIAGASAMVSQEVFGFDGVARGGFFISLVQKGGLLAGVSAGGRRGRSGPTGGLAQRGHKGVLPGRRWAAASGGCFGARAASFPPLNLVVWRSYRFTNTYKFAAF